MIKILKYTEEYFDRWNRFVEQSNNGTLFHRLDFLTYHGERFKVEEHHLIWLKGEAIFAVMPFAIFEENGVRIGKSPYGASFGGPVFSHKFKLKHALELVDCMLKYFKSIGLSSVNLTLPPLFYHIKANSSFEFALSRAGFQIASRDVFNALRLGNSYESIWEKFESRARTSIRKARQNFDIELDVSIKDFYPILKEDKWRHNKAKPTHSLSELETLKKSFPANMFCDVATLKDNGAKAGICYFMCNSSVMMTFYMAQEKGALRENGTNVLLEYGFQRAVDEGISYFDFGGSSIGYQIQNIGVAEFKEGFGASSYLRETYIIDLEKVNV